MWVAGLGLWLIATAWQRAATPGWGLEIALGLRVVAYLLMAGGVLFSVLRAWDSERRGPRVPSGAQGPRSSKSPPASEVELPDDAVPWNPYAGNQP
jgi:hypothetical protein